MTIQLWVLKTPIDRRLIETCQRAAAMSPRERQQPAVVREIFGLACSAHIEAIRELATSREAPEIVWALICAAASQRKCSRDWVAKLVGRSPRNACGLLHTWFRYCAARRAGKSRPIPNSIKRGLADAIGGMSPEDISAAALIRGRVRFRDVVALVHPRMPTAQGMWAVGALMGGGRQ